MTVRDDEAANLVPILETPSMSSLGNMSPASMTTMSSPHSSTIMFLPICPRPPRGMSRKLAGADFFFGRWRREAEREGCVVAGGF